MLRFFILLLGFTLINSQFAGAIPYCAAIFAPALTLHTHRHEKSPEYKKANPTAQLSFDHYPQANKRSLNRYNSTFNISLQRRTKPGSLVIDLGGGPGVAMLELAEATGAKTIVINTQWNPDIPVASNGEFIYRRGWVEEILPEYINVADIIVDLWGAFSYSINKKEILEDVWNALKPGGDAFLYFNYRKTPATIYNRENGKYYLHRWLATRFPQFVKYYDVIGDEGESVIIHLHKPAQPTGRLNIHLKYKHHSNSEKRSHHWPSVHYLDMFPSKHEDPLRRH